MFSDRLWILKAAAALGLFGWLCTDARRTLSELQPDLERVALYTNDLNAHVIHAAGKQVRSSDAAGFEVSTRVGPMRVLSALHPPVGATVSMNVRPVGPRTVQALSVQVHEGYAWKRPLNYGISILTVIAYLWIIRKRFRWRIEEGVIRSKY